jgi:plastocyanin
MDKRLVAVSGVIALLVIAGGAYAVMKNRPASTTSTDNMPMSTNNSSNSSNSGNQAPTATDKVSLQNFAFSPASITVAKGTTVTWTNNDTTTHTIVETDGKTGPNSGNVNPGSTYTFTFSQAGTYQYHCSIHPEMTGTVTVTE